MGKGIEGASAGVWCTVRIAAGNVASPEIVKLHSQNGKKPGELRDSSSTWEDARGELDDDACWHLQAVLQQEKDVSAGCSSRLAWHGMHEVCQQPFPNTSEQASSRWDVVSWESLCWEVEVLEKSCSQMSGLEHRGIFCDGKVALTVRSGSD